MRFKRRYFCIQIEFVDQVSAFQASKLRHTHLSDGIHESIEQFYGDYGVATLMPSFSVIFYNSVTHLAIVRAARDFQVEHTHTFSTNTHLSFLNFFFFLLLTTEPYFRSSSTTCSHLAENSDRSTSPTESYTCRVAYANANNIWSPTVTINCPS